MIDKEGVSCDGCTNWESFPYQPFKYMCNRIKEKGWKIVKWGTAFRHYCPDCVEQKKHWSPEFRAEMEAKQQTYWWNQD